MEGISRRGFVATAAAALGAAVVASGCAGGRSSADGNRMTAGYGTANGKGGQVKVEAVASDGVLTALSVVESRESYGIGTEAMEVLSSLIVENQTLYVDTVSGATMTSMAFLSAAADAIDEAGLKSKDFKKAAHAFPALPDGFTDGVDIVVIGSAAPATLRRLRRLRRVRKPSCSKS